MKKLVLSILLVLGLALMPGAGLAGHHEKNENPCNPCNPCAENPCNPCADNPCNPCGGNPCNPCNPCGGTNSCDKDDAPADY
ncbi:MAG: hypothetical protein QNK05_24915 [Myxococcota bacterium]|nr:hypothetical protein [Myxococcota bacterium]